MKLFDVYSLFDIEPVKANGSWFWDKNGIKYLDLYGGHAVISIGHTHPYYVKKITEQLHEIGFYSNAVKNPQQERLAEQLGKLSGYPNYELFLCNSGAEANENALKLASFHTGRKKIIAFTGAFHGRTSATVAATDDASIISPLNQSENVQFLPFNDEQALEKVVADNEVCAFIIEGVQGIGGVHVPGNYFLQKIKTICEATGALLILDEIQSGYGRTGKFFAHQYAGIQPDIITIAKGMGNGFPVAGVLINPKIKSRHNLLGTTFGGNYLACIAAISVLKVIEEEGLIDHAAVMGDYLMEKLSHIEGVKEVRGLGLMIGIELDFPSADIRKQLLTEHKIFTGASSNKNTIRILPALNLKKEEAAMFLAAFNKVMLKSLITTN